MKLPVKYILWTVALLIVLTGAAVYLFVRRKSVSIPGNGSDIPKDWNPAPVAVIIHDTMAGLGTDTTTFFATLTPLTIGQRALVYNYYNQHLGNLIEDIKDDFSGDELSRALSFFADIPGTGLRIQRSVASRYQRSIVS